MLNGILWILRTGASWADLPDRYPSKPASGGFLQWVRLGVLQSILESPRSGTARTKAIWQAHSHSGLSISCRCVSSATTPTSRTGWTRNWRTVAWN